MADRTEDDADRGERNSLDLDALSHLRAVRDSYWDPGWRREHRRLGRYPEHESWEAVEGKLDLYDATTDGDCGSR